MEIHAHKSQASGTRKKWTHYFWEFLMLFLAVFCGFLAEYQLEHKIEHNREKQFIKAFVNDIKADTAQLSSIKSFRLARLSNMDSLMRFFADNSSSTIPLYMLSRMEHLKGHVSFYQSSGTLDQLKNSGGLRLIRRRVVVDSIQAYDQQIKRMLLRDQFEAEEMRYTRRIAYHLVDGRLVAKIHADTIYFNKPAPAGSETLALNTPYIGEYLNSLATFRFVLISNMMVQENIKRKGVDLLDLIKKEYHIE